MLNPSLIHRAFLEARRNRSAPAVSGSHFAEDLPQIVHSMTRRRWLRGAAALGALAASGCIASADSDLENADGTCNGIPEETAGPYPGDGSNGPNVLGTDGVVRQDLRSSFGSLSGTAAGTALTIRLSVWDQNCEPLAGYAIYLWHCDVNGDYSLYNLEDQNYLRGVQVTDDNGEVTFTTIFPGCYDGRWPHAHFEVFTSLEAATGGEQAVATSQLALPADACASVYATSTYASSSDNFGRQNLDSDNIFSDGYSRQLATVTDDGGLVAALTFAV